MTAVIADEDILGIAGDLWSSYLGEEALPAMLGTLTPEISSNVSVFGAWNGTVVVATTARGARLVGSALLEIPEDELTKGDIDDAVGELANIVGGNVKSVLPGPSSLTLPVVSHGAVAVNERAAVIVGQAALEWWGEVFEITVWHGPAEGGVV